MNSFWIILVFTMVMCLFLVLVLYSSVNILFEYFSRSDSIFNKYYSLCNNVAFFWVATLSSSSVCFLLIDFWFIRLFTSLNNFVAYLNSDKLDNNISFLVLPLIIIICCGFVSNILCWVNIFNKKSKTGYYSKYLIACALVSLLLYILCLTWFINGSNSNFIVFVGVCISECFGFFFFVGICTCVWSYYIWIYCRDIFIYLS